jgi:hypothetical protein
MQAFGFCTVRIFLGLMIPDLIFCLIRNLENKSVEPGLGHSATCLMQLVGSPGAIEKYKRAFGYTNCLKLLTSRWQHILIRILARKSATLLYPIDCPCRVLSNPFQNLHKKIFATTTNANYFWLLMQNIMKHTKRTKKRPNAGKVSG